jgi:hypothetical protein
MEKIVSRIVMLWMSLIFISIGSLYKNMNDEALLFYNFGPSNNLIVFGLVIDTFPKYAIVIIYCFLSSLVRTLSRDILSAYLVNSVQDVTKKKNKQLCCFAYEVTYVTSIYTWVDWYMYMNLLLAQVDMLLTEIISDLIVSVLTTRYYLHHHQEEEKENEETIIVDISEDKAKKQIITLNSSEELV